MCVRLPLAPRSPYLCDSSPMAVVTFALAAVGTAILHFTYTTENFNRQQAAQVITGTQQATDTHVTDSKDQAAQGCRGDLE